jgi:hypothetical protein
LLPNRALRAAIVEYASQRSKFLQSTPVIFIDSFSPHNELKFEVFELNPAQSSSSSLELRLFINQGSEFMRLKQVVYDPNDCTLTLSEFDSSKITKVKVDNQDTTSSSSSSSSSALPSVCDDLKLLVEIVPTCSWMVKEITTTATTMLLSDTLSSSTSISRVVLNDDDDESEANNKLKQKRKSSSTECEEEEEEGGGVFLDQKKRTRMEEESDESTHSTNSYCSIS